MREKPDLQDAEIKDGLLHHYGLEAAEITFLPKGGDIHAAAYRVVRGDGTAYFLKLRRGTFDEAALFVPEFLSDAGIPTIISPIRTKRLQLWTRLGDFFAVLTPFVAGRNAFEAALKEEQWTAFGAALSAVHATVVPAGLSKRIRHETYDPQWRERVRVLLMRVKKDTYPEPVAAQYAGFLAQKADEIAHIVQKAEQLSVLLRAKNPGLVLCHSDVHAGNLLIDASGKLYIVDWDEPVLAAKERDLMFIGGGVGSVWYRPEEEVWFYQGYGPAAVDPVGLAYYRFERIVQDIAEWGERVLLTEQGGQDRSRWLQGLRRWFQPHDVVAMAYLAEKKLSSGK